MNNIFEMLGDFFNRNQNAGQNISQNNSDYPDPFFTPTNNSQNINYSTMQNNNGQNTWNFNSNFLPMLMQFLPLLRGSKEAKSSNNLLSLISALGQNNSNLAGIIDALSSTKKEKATNEGDKKNKKLDIPIIDMSNYTEIN